MTRNNGVYPPSVNAGHPRIEAFPQTWTRYRLRDLLVDAMRPVTLEAETDYQLIVAKRNRNGIAKREVLAGHKIKTPSQYRLEGGDFVIAKRQIAHGACGFVPEDLAGAIVSSEYDVFRVNESLVMPEFFELCTYSAYFQQTCFHASIGVTVEKLVFMTERWLKYDLPLPGLAAQARAVTLFQWHSKALAAAEALLAAKHRQKAGLLQQLMPSGSSPRDEHRSLTRVRFGDVVSRVTDQYDATRDGARGLKCLELEHLESETGRILGATDACITRSQKTIFQTGDTLFGKLRPYLRKFARPDFAGVCSSEIWVFRPSDERLTESFLYLLVQAQPVQAAAAITCGTKMPRANWSDLAKAIILLPTREEQNKICAAILALDAEVDAMQSRIACLREQKRALLQKLFNGELELHRRSKKSEGAQRGR